MTALLFAPHTNNNPVNRTDPSGHQVKLPHFTFSTEGWPNWLEKIVSVACGVLSFCYVDANNGGGSWGVVPTLPMVVDGVVPSTDLLSGLLDTLEPGEIIGESIPGATTPPNNLNDDPYPNVIDPRTGEPIPYPEDAEWTEKDQRVRRPSDYRDDYIEEWRRRGYPEPEGGWDLYRIHHIQPLEYGGDNSFENGVPVTIPDHDLFNYYWRGNRPPITDR